MDIKEKFKKYNVVFATNGDTGKDSPILLSVNSYSNCFSKDNFIFLRSENGRWFGKNAFLKLFDYGIEHKFSYLIYIDADCFIANSENLYNLFEKFVDNDCILAGPSDGGIICHRNCNRFSINPFLMFVSLNKIANNFKKNNIYSFHNITEFDEKNVTTKSFDCWNSTVLTYKQFRDEHPKYVVPHAIEISKPHNPYEIYYGNNQIPWSWNNSTTFEPYYDIFLNMHNGNENMYFMYGRDYPCISDPSGITSAVYLDKDISNDSGLVCLHTWFTRLSNSDRGRFGNYMRNRIFSVGNFALKLNNLNI